MKCTVLKTPHRISKLYCLRLGLILAGVCLVGQQSVEQVEAPPAETAPAEVIQSHHCCQGNYYLQYMADGDAHLAAREYKLAERDYAAALQETSKFNAASFCVIDTMQSLANVYLYEKKYKKAVALFEKIETLSEKTLPVDDVRLTETLLDLAVSYTHNRQPAKAEATFKRIVAMWESAPAGWEVNRAISFHNLASFYLQHGRQADAVAVLFKQKPGNFSLQIGSSNQHGNNPYQHYAKFSFAPNLCILNK